MEPNTSQTQKHIKVKFIPVQFTEREIFTFTYISCNGVLSVCTDITKSDSPLWVNFGVLTNFAKLYLYYWNRAFHADSPLAIEQRKMLCNILFKITHVHSLAVQRECSLNHWVDLRKLMSLTLKNKKDNLFLATYPHHEYNILEIEKIGLEQAKVELQLDLFDEPQVKDLLMFSKLMALQLHGLSIP